MASIPGEQFNITGASGSQGLLSPKSSWRCYVLPRGGHASQDSTGTQITFDSAAVASRFAVNNWIQVALSTANIRRVSAVGGNSISVSGDAVTVTENQRVFLIGNTQPTVSGGSATYLTPLSVIRQRDDDGADIFTNSMVTSNADGLIQFWAAPNFYDAIIQDGNQSNQGSIVDMPVGSVGGISTDTDALFGASVTVNGAIGITGWATFGSTATFNAAIGVTGWATFGSTVTMNAALGVTGHAVFGATLTAHGALGVTGPSTLGGSVTLGANGVISGLSVTTGIFGVSNQPRCLVRLTSSVGVQNDTNFGVTFTSETYDVGGMHDTVTNPGRITIPAGAGGAYLITALGTWGNTTTSVGFRLLQLNKNGSETAPRAASLVIGSSASQAGTVVHGFATVDNALPGDYYELLANQVSGDTVTLFGGAGRTTTFGAAKIA